MSTKEINVLDTNVNLDESSISATHTRTDIRVYEAGTEILLYRGSNKIILPGAAFTARCHFELPRIEVTPSYNTELQLENSVYETPSTPEKAYLFCVGTDGCGRENSQVREVNYSKWLPTTYMVPFRFPLLTEDISAVKKEKYHGRKVIGNRAAYYFKTFESAPTLIQRFEDGTSIDSAIYYFTSHTSRLRLAYGILSKSQASSSLPPMNTLGENVLALTFILIFPSPGLDVTLYCAFFGTIK